MNMFDIAMTASATFALLYAGDAAAAAYRRHRRARRLP
jgi:hypothetical protein